jgi:hypothetical protein
MHWIDQPFDHHKSIQQMFLVIKLKIQILESLVWWEAIKLMALFFYNKFLTCHPNFKALNRMP